MRNEELFSPGCPVAHAKKLVMDYVLRGLTDDRGTYFPDRLLAKQHAVYEEWLTAIREFKPDFDCDFYEWLGRSGDAAFVFRPGDLVKHDGRYSVVVRRCTQSGWMNHWHIRNRMPVQDVWPLPLCAIELKDPDGRTCVVDALAENIEPADIPPEVFALACGKAKNCPMVKGDCE